MVTVEDWVAAQARLADQLGIAQFAAVMGGSLGAMQALQWTISHPDKLRHALVIACAPNLSAQNIAFNEVARQAILTDPDFHGGDYYEHGVKPHRGLARRAHGRPHHLSLRRRDGVEIRPPAEERQARLFVRHRVPDRVVPAPPGGQVLRILRRQYLLAHHQGARLFRSRLSSTAAISRARSRTPARAFLVVSFTTDWRFSPERSREIVKALLDNRADVTYAEIDAPHGHDAFLLDDERYHRLVAAYFDRIAPGMRRMIDGRGERHAHAQRADFAAIAGWIDVGSSVLDLGCGDGTLLRYLKETAATTATASRSPTTACSRA